MNEGELIAKAVAPFERPGWECARGKEGVSFPLAIVPTDSRSSLALGQGNYTEVLD